MFAKKNKRDYDFASKLILLSFPRKRESRFFQKRMIQMDPRFREDDRKGY